MSPAMKLISLVLSVAGLVLFLVVTLSTPITKNMALLHIEGKLISAKLGVLGMCYHVSDEGVKCTSPQVGFYLDNNYLTKMSDDDVHKKDFRTMTAVMITNPLTAAFGGLSLILSFLLVRVGREVVSVLFLLLTTLTGFVAVVINLTVVLVVRNRVSRTTDGAYTGHVGTVFWLSLGGLGAYLLALCCSIFACCKGKKKNSEPQPREVTEWYRRTVFPGKK